VSTLARTEPVPRVKSALARLHIEGHSPHPRGEFPKEHIGAPRYPANVLPHGKLHEFCAINLPTDNGLTIRKDEVWVPKHSASGTLIQRHDWRDCRKAWPDPIPLLFLPNVGETSNYETTNTFVQVQT